MPSCGQCYAQTPDGPSGDFPTRCRGVFAPARRRYNMVHGGAGTRRELRERKGDELSMWTQTHTDVAMIHESQGRSANVMCRKNAALVGLLVVAGCGTLPGPMRERLVAANKQYESGNYPAARGELDAILKDYPKAVESAEAYYLRALCEARAQETEPATKDLDRCLQLSRRPD